MHLGCARNHLNDVLGQTPTVDERIMAADPKAYQHLQVLVQAWHYHSTERKLH